VYFGQERVGMLVVHSLQRSTFYNDEHMLLDSAESISSGRQSPF
jgi:hypothetical protein